MNYNGKERRAHKRINVPGATVTYKEEKFFLSKERYVEEFLPVVEISRGGIRFLCQKLFTTTRKISLKVSIPEEESPILLVGRVRWASSTAATSYRYQIGIQFNPYGRRKRHNDPDILKKIIALEKKFLSNDHDKSNIH
ncbi:MAG: PilZ domain-containing protein [Candidatus Aminicenantes bacterium]|nr:PilZ domain-containing protein [Candidatus Aminicenantes bacterium]MDH5704815.1 PilZ domain-containing protein [Candidatus Aminicenantes bacterium]